MFVVPLSQNSIRLEYKVYRVCFFCKMHRESASILSPPLKECVRHTYDRTEDLGDVYTVLSP